MHHEAQCRHAVAAHRLGAPLPSSTRSVLLRRPRARRQDGRPTSHDYLCEITGFAGMSLQPNSGAQGEYTGLLVIRAYPRLARGVPPGRLSDSLFGPWHQSRIGRHVRHGGCRGHGLRPVTATSTWTSSRPRPQLHADRLGALMITYPSTHGVFEEHISRGDRKRCMPTAARSTWMAPT